MCVLHDLCMVKVLVVYAIHVSHIMTGTSLLVEVSSLPLAAPNVFPNCSFFVDVDRKIML